MRSFLVVAAALAAGLSAPASAGVLVRDFSYNPNQPPITIALWDDARFGRLDRILVEGGYGIGVTVGVAPPYNIPANVTGTLSAFVNSSFGGYSFANTPATVRRNPFNGGALDFSAAGVRNVELTGAQLDPYKGAGTFQLLFSAGSPGLTINDLANNPVPFTRARNDVSISQRVTYFYEGDYNFFGVPEPSTWAMMLAGFGAIGGAMRRRPQKALTPQ